jgi:hypothetical protein
MKDAYEKEEKMLGKPPLGNLDNMSILLVKND